MRPPPYQVALHSNGPYWQARWYDADGRRRTRSIGSKRKLKQIAAAQEARALERQIRLEAAGGVPTLATLEDRTIGKRHDLKAGTRAIYAKAVGLLREFAALHLRGDATRLDQVDRAAASEFREWLLLPRASGRTIRLTTANRYLRALRSLYSMAGDRMEGAGLANPFARRRWPSPQVAQDWGDVTHADLDKLMAVCPSDGWRALLGLCRLAGLRRGEALRLRVGDYNRAKGMLTVLPEEDASGARVEGTKQRARAVPVRPQLARVLDRAVKGRGPAELVCAGVNVRNLERTLRGGAVGGRVSERRKKRRYLGLFAKAGLTAPAKPLQTMRRNCGTEWAEQGIPITDVARFMGNSVAVASVYYVRTTAGTFARITGAGTTPGPNQTERTADDAEKA